jgi:hypothetical protein
LTDSASFISINNSLFGRFEAGEIVPIFCECLLKFPNAVHAYNFLEQRLPLFDAGDTRAMETLSMTITQLVEHSTAMLFPLIDKIKQHLILLRHHSSPRSNTTGPVCSSLMPLSLSLDECFAQIESGNDSEHAFAIVCQLASHLRKVPFPDRPFRPTMYFCLKAWSALEIDDSVDASKCLDVLKKIHALEDEAANLLAAYDEFSVDLSLRDAPVELAYSDFRRHRGGMLPDGSEMPYSLAKARDVDERGELAILQMQKLATAYDGVANLWELLKWAPNYDIASRFETFNASQRYFLISGFRAKLAEEQESGAGDRAQIIDRLEKLLHTRKRNIDHEVSEIGKRLSHMHEEAARLTPERRTARVVPTNSRSQTPTSHKGKWSSP